MTSRFKNSNCTLIKININVIAQSLRGIVVSKQYIEVQKNNCLHLTEMKE